MRMDQKEIKRLLLMNAPYVVVGLIATNLGEGWRLAEGFNASEKLLSLMATLPVAFRNPLPSVHPLDLLIGLLCGAALRLAVYVNHIYISLLGEFIVAEENGTMRLNGGDTVYTRKADIERAIQLNRESHADVYNAIAQKVWLFNGGGDTVLNYIKFSEQKAEMGQTYVDHNGIHDNGVNENDYLIEDSTIIVKTADGGELTIPYTLSDGVITLGEGAYLSLDQVEESIQGYWKCRYSSDYGKHESNLLIDHGIIKSERAATALNGEPGEYYYYGPYEGTYTLGIGKFETDMFNGKNWFYNIVNGIPTIFEYERMCVRSDGFPGENGYYF